MCGNPAYKFCVPIWVWITLLHFQYCWVFWEMACSMIQLERDNQKCNRVINKNNLYPLRSTKINQFISTFTSLLVAFASWRGKECAFHFVEICSTQIVYIFKIVSSLLTKFLHSDQSFSRNIYTYLFMLRIWNICVCTIRSCSLERTYCLQT